MLIPSARGRGGKERGELLLFENTVIIIIYFSIGTGLGMVETLEI